MITKHGHKSVQTNSFTYGSH